MHGSVATATATAIATATAAATVAAAAAAAVAAAAGAPVGSAAIGTAVKSRRKPSSCRKQRRHACRAARGWRHLQDSERSHWTTCTPGPGCKQLHSHVLCVFSHCTTRGRKLKYC